jgi:hypothetical protein
MRLKMISNEFLLARSYLYGAEDIIELKNFKLDHSELLGSTRKFEVDAVDYQPEKGDRGRKVLDLVGSIDNNSNQSLQSSELNEMDFTEDTIYLKSMPAFSKFLHSFEYGRSHVIYMSKGGFFPPHRDGPIFPHFDKECFRIIVPIEGCEEDDFTLVVGNKIVPLQNGRAYYVNTFKKHYAFSFTDRCKFVILNIRITLENVKALSEYIVK